MADGHFPDVELLRRELAALILEWAGKAVKDDPDGPMATALTRAVAEAARGAVAEQHQALTAETADRIAEALDRRDRAGGLFVWRASPLNLTVAAIAAAGLLGGAYFLGLQTGRTEVVLPSAPAPAATAPIAPLAPAGDEPATPGSESPRPAVQPQRAKTSAAKPAATRPAPRELGRPAPAGDEAPSRSTQPVGAATATTPAAPKTEPKP